MSRSPRAGLALLSQDKSSIVLVRGARSGMWSLPKGKVEDNESTIQAAIRECEEETGIAQCQYTLEDKLFVKNHCSIFGAHMRGQCPNLAPPRPDEITEIRWVPVAELESYMSNANESLRFLIQYRDEYII